MTDVISSPLKFHGGKQYLADRLWKLAPPHIHRVHPYGGGFGEGWNWPTEGYSEVYNDIDGRLTNFFLVLKDPGHFEEFKRQVEATPFSEFEWNRANAHSISPLALIGSAWRNGFTVSSGAMVAAAVEFFVLVRQSMAGRMDSFAPLSRNRVRRGMNEQVSAWLTAIDGLPAVHRRLMRMVILNQSALKVIRQQDGENTLFYADPPYLHETRTAKDVYEYEMSWMDHARLLVTLSRIKGKFMLSGYDSALYRLAEKKYGWRRHEWDLPNNAASGSTKRRMKEILLCNYDAPSAGK